MSSHRVLLPLCALVLLGALPSTEEFVQRPLEVFPPCGDGVVQAGESCDDGNLNGTANSCCTTLCAFGGKSPDVVVGDLSSTVRYGTLNGITAYSIGTTSCNVGSCWLKWVGQTADHPVIGQNMFRLKHGRFEQIGQSWLKHGFAAIQGSLCATSQHLCVPAGTSNRLGVNCSDPYDAFLNGAQGAMGPKVDVNPSTGVFRYPDQRIGTSGNVLFKRLQVRNLDLDPALNAGALYFVEGQYVTRDDAEAGKQNNNASWRRVSVGPAPYTLTLEGVTQRGEPAIKAWKANDPSVVMSTIAADGLFLMGAKVTPLGGNLYHYEYAVQNLGSHRGARSFSVPLPAGVVVTNPDFHDVNYHSGEPFDGMNWPVEIAAAAVTWSTETYEVNANANALRWGTLYNFRFDADRPPGLAVVTLGMFRPGSPASHVAVTLAPVGD